MNIDQQLWAYCISHVKTIYIDYKMVHRNEHFNKYFWSFLGQQHNEVIYPTVLLVIQLVLLNVHKAFNFGHPESTKSEALKSKESIQQDAEADSKTTASRHLKT